LAGRLGLPSSRFCASSQRKRAEDGSLALFVFCKRCLLRALWAWICITASRSTSRTMERAPKYDRTRYPLFLLSFVRLLCSMPLTLGITNGASLSVCRRTCRVRPPRGSPRKLPACKLGASQPAAVTPKAASFSPESHRGGVARETPRHQERLRRGALEGWCCTRPEKERPSKHWRCLGMASLPLEGTRDGMQVHSV